MTRAKQIRVLLLLMLLTPLVYAFSMPSSPAPNWDRTKIIAIYPYNADGTESTQAYIDQLSLSDFREIESFLSSQARDYGLPLTKPFSIELLEQIEKAPSLPPNDGYLESLRWALDLRWWHWRLDAPVNNTDIVVVARFQSSSETELHLHSIGMPSPRLALVSLAADTQQHDQNLVVLTHEILHTIGANDHYAKQSGLPSWPAGYANPTQQPRYPQLVGELMAGRIPLSPALAREASSLNEIVIGPKTARDIGWSRH